MSYKRAELAERLSLTLPEFMGEEQEGGGGGR